MTEKQKIEDLKAKLNRRYYALISRTIYRNFAELVADLREQKYNFAHQDCYFPRSNVSRTARLMILRVATYTSNSYVSTKPSTPRLSSKKEFPAKYRDLERLTDAKKAEYKKNNICWSCREPGHSL